MKQFFALLNLFSVAACVSTFTPARPPALPLANRNPYMATFLQAGSDGGNGGYLAGEWPTFWLGSNSILGWTGMIRVDGANYVWMGNPAVNLPLVNQVSYEYTSTRSIFTMHVGTTIQMVIEFLSPVTPTDMMRASFPASYLNVEISSLDGKSHSVQLYSDISAEWISGNRSAIAQWDYGVIDGTGSKRDEAAQVKLKSSSRTAPSEAFPTNPNPGGVAYHHVFRQTQLFLSEIEQQTEYGDWYYATNNGLRVSHQSGADQTVRSQFIKKGYLTGAQDTKYRPINHAYPVFGFSQDFPSVGPKSTRSMYFTINLAQQSVIRFEGAQGNVTLPGLWTSYFSSNLDAVSFFYNDYKTVSGLCDTLDSKIASDSLAAGGQNYATITQLAVRQAFAATQFAGNTTTPYLFLKEISSSGNVQTVDVIFPFHPIAIYLNPSLIKLLLEPLFINQEAGYWAYKYALHDLGKRYPNATGYSTPYEASLAEKLPLEESGDMIIMTLAYAQRTGDNAFLSQHYNILKQWNNFLVKEALIPRYQRSTDDFAGALANQTNLALKGIIGIQAMSQIAQLVNNTADAQNFSTIAHQYIAKWQQLGIAQHANPPHATLAYHKNHTYGLLYNLYADRELGLGLVPQSVYDMQSTFYPTVAGNYGVILDTRHQYTKVDWELLCAAIASNSTRDLFTQKVATWIDQTPTNLAFTDLYEVPDGNYPGFAFINRPVVGAMFSVLALQSAPT